MNLELSMLIAKENVQNWQRQADLERQVNAANRFQFKLPKLHLPRLNRSARRPA
jgi:hypothetical protein